MICFSINATILVICIYSKPVDNNYLGTFQIVPLYNRVCYNRMDSNSIVRFKTERKLASYLLMFVITFLLRN